MFQDGLLSSTALALASNGLQDKFLKSKRYAPKDINYYDQRLFTYDNRPKTHPVNGAFHPHIAGLLILKMFKMSGIYDDSRKWERVWGVKHDKYYPQVSLTDFITGMATLSPLNHSKSIKFIIKNGYKFISYVGEYDSVTSDFAVFDAIKPALKKKEYKKFWRKEWSHFEELAWKVHKNIYLAILFNSNHMISAEQAPYVYSFVQKAIQSDLLII